MEEILIQQFYWKLGVHPHNIPQAATLTGGGGVQAVLSDTKTCHRSEETPLHSEYTVFWNE